MPSQPGPKYKSYSDRNAAGRCAVTRCECKLKADSIWINSLNGNLYCGPCKDFFYFGHDRDDTSEYRRTWEQMVVDEATVIWGGLTLSQLEAIA